MTRRDPYLHRRTPHGGPASEHSVPAPAQFRAQVPDPDSIPADWSPAGAIPASGGPSPGRNGIDSSVSDGVSPSWRVGAGPVADGAAAWDATAEWGSPSSSWNSVPDAIPPSWSGPPSQDHMRRGGNSGGAEPVTAAWDRDAAPWPAAAHLPVPTDRTHADLPRTEVVAPTHLARSAEATSSHLARSAEPAPADLARSGGAGPAYPAPEGAARAGPPGSIDLTMATGSPVSTGDGPELAGGKGKGGRGRRVDRKAKLVFAAALAAAALAGGGVGAGIMAAIGGDTSATAPAVPAAPDGQAGNGEQGGQQTVPGQPPEMPGGGLPTAQPTQGA
jgi:hypothetical protein